MGMGMLGAMAGAGQAIEGVGKQMFASSLEQDRQNFLIEKQRMLAVEAENRQVARADTERSRIGGIMSSAVQGTANGNGPPNPDGSFPQEPLNKQQKDQRIIEALQNSGDIDAAVKYKQLSSREETSSDRLANMMAMKMMQEEGKKDRFEGRDETTRRGQDLSYDARMNGGGRGGKSGSGSKSGSRSGSGGVADDDFDIEDFEKRVDKVMGVAYPTTSMADPSERLTVNSNAVKFASINKGMDAAKAVDLAMKVQSGDLKPSQKLGIVDGVVVQQDVADGYALSKPVAIRSPQVATKFLSSLIGDDEFMADLAKKDDDYIVRFAESGKMAALSKQSGLSTNDIANVLLNGVERYKDGADDRENSSRSNTDRETRGVTRAEQKQEQKKKEDRPVKVSMPDTSSSWSIEAPRGQNPYADVAYPKHMPFGQAANGAVESGAELLDIINGAKNKQALGMLHAYPKRDAVRERNSKN